MTARAIQRAIIALEAYANAQGTCTEDVRMNGGDLALEAWGMVAGGGASADVLRSDALEAAAMLRDGYLPGHDGWTSRIYYEAVL